MAKFGKKWITFRGFFRGWNRQNSDHFSAWFFAFSDPILPLFFLDFRPIFSINSAWFFSDFRLLNWPQTLIFISFQLFFRLLFCSFFSFYTYHFGRFLSYFISSFTLLQTCFWGLLSFFVAPFLVFFRHFAAGFCCFEACILSTVYEIQLFFSALLSVFPLSEQSLSLFQPLFMLHSGFWFFRFSFFNFEDFTAIWYNIFLIVTLSFLGFSCL